MSNQPLVSVIIPAYNHERYVEETIRSILSQTYQNIELIVCDDGSKDATWQKLCALKPECEKRFKRVVFLTQENQGTCANANRLHALTEGEYVYPIASDDVVKTHAIERLIAVMEAHPEAVLVVGDNEFIDADSVRIGWSETCASVPLAEAPYKSFAQYLQAVHHFDFKTPQFGAYKTFLQKNNHVPNGYLIRNCALKKMGKFTKEAPLEDLYQNFQLAKQGTFIFIDEILFSYRWHGANTATKRQHMQAMQDKTYQYEYSQIKKDMKSPWWKAYNECFGQERWRLGPFLRYYRLRDRYRTMNILEIFGIKWTLKHKVHKHES